MKTLTLETLSELLDSRNRTEPVTIVTETEPKMRKTGNPYFGKVCRLAERNVFIGASYESCVNRQREREGTEEYFSALELWKGKGQHVGKHLVQHVETGELYIAYKPTTDVDNDIRTKQSEYRNVETGEVIPDSELAPYFPPIRSSERQETAKEVFWRTLKLRNLKRIAIGGELYDVDCK